MGRAKEPWWPDLLVFLAMASGIGYLAACYAVSRRLTRASLGRLQRTPAEYGWPWEPLTCQTADGFRLAGWVVEPARPRATVVLCHGVWNNREQLLGRTALLAEAGYRCIAFDHRAHGESAGRRTSFGWYEGRDVTAALELVRQRWPHQPIALLGLSMGAAAICFAAEQARDCAAVVLESLYHDIGSAFAHRLQTTYPRWLRRLAGGIVWMTERRLGVRLANVAPAEHIGRLAPAPVLLLTGTDDAHAPPAEAERLLQRCRGPAELWLAPNAVHTDVFEVDPAAYRQRVLGFLDRCLPAPAPV